MIKDNLRILLVEDHPFQLRATQYLLESYGFTRLTTTDCAQGALQQMLGAEQPFDILLCDQCLPDISGIDLVKFASRNGMIKQAILLSSLTPDELDGLENMASIHDLPLLGYLVKPLKQAELTKLLISKPLNTNQKARSTYNKKHTK
ncbi:MULTISPECIES: response regulator [Pseudomonas]|uniref:Response regulator n=1 Tax=Pseudomonas izuensis TaxID=2684212 RepID=A0ABM7RV50_9PSED|nr:MULTISPECIES: response regulator [Pseudomonas]RKS12629.1 CheY-like chemotaxis protein [Pseudomonas sp. WPR_5_2]BCX69670.1 response regulator [Pseudomonas izuensis]